MDSLESDETYLIVGIDLTPAVFLHLSSVYGDVVPTNLEVFTDRFPSLLSAFNHTAQSPV
jgi:hypothetical protein